MLKKVIEQLLTEVTKKSHNMHPCEVMFAHIKFLLKLICDDLLKVNYNLAVVTSRSQTLAFLWTSEKRN